MFGMGHPIAADDLWGVCLIRLAWAALWLRPPYGRALNMFGVGCPMAAAVGHVLNMFRMGHPIAADALWCVCLICLAWAALWLRPPYGACA